MATTTKLGNRYESSEGTYQAKVVYTTTQTNTEYRVQSAYYIHAITRVEEGTFLSFGMEHTLSGYYNSSVHRDTPTIAAGTDSLKEFSRDTTFTRGRTDKTYSVTYECDNNFMPQYYYGSSVTFSFTVPALQHWTVTYNANGGSGAPSSQPKYYGETLTLSSTIPTKTGYTFAGWKSSAGYTYSAGGSYGRNEATTMMAQWTPNTATIKYNANGGSGSIASQTKTYGKSLTLSNGSGFTRSNYTLLRWNTRADGSGTPKPLGPTGKLDANTATAMTLYAVWQADYKKPTISNLVAFRCDNSGTANDDGTYIHVQFDYVGGIVGGGSSRRPTISIKIGSSTVYGPTKQSSGTGTFSATYGSSYSVNSAYTVQVSAYDDDYTSEVTTANLRVPSSTFPIDILADGSAMGIMAPAVSGKKISMPEIFLEGHSGSIGAYGGTTLSKEVAPGTSFVSLPDDAGVELYTGRYIVDAYAGFAGNTTGFRGIRINDGSSTVQTMSSHIQPALSNGNWTNRLHTSAIIVADNSSTTVNVQVLQNSGASLSVTIYIRWIRIR